MRGVNRTTPVWNSRFLTAKAVRNDRTEKVRVERNGNGTGIAATTQLGKWKCTSWRELMAMPSTVAGLKRQLLSVATTF